MISNINNKNVDQAVKVSNRNELEEKFAAYWIAYPHFKIFFNGQELEFRSIIKNIIEEKTVFEKEGFEYNFITKIIEMEF